MKQNLSPSQEEAVAVARRHGGKLARLSGGFWTYPSCPMGKNGVVPTWWASTRTVEGLVKAGVFRATSLGPGKRILSVELASS